MLTKIIKDESFLIAAVKQHYGLRVSQIDFIPEGDISFAYVVTCAGG
jgi:hypothetical protein